MMNLSQHLLQQANALLEASNGLAVTSIMLPDLNLSNDCRDQFGLVILNERFVGPFYVSLEPILKKLWQLYPQPNKNLPQLASMLDGLLTDDITRRALGIGAYNAISHYYFHQHPNFIASHSKPKAPAASTVGMVGHFDTLIDRLIKNGSRIFLLEDDAERIVERQGLEVVDSPKLLNQCEQVICTASTIINNTLEAILSDTPDVKDFQLVGPTASGYPEPYFKAGVTTIGGLLFNDAESLPAKLAQSEHFSEAATKYNISSN